MDDAPKEPEEKPKRWDYYVFSGKPLTSGIPPHTGDCGPWRETIAGDGYEAPGYLVNKRFVDREGWQLINGWLVREAKE